MLPTELSIEERCLFWRNYDKWCAMFTAHEVIEQLAKLPIHDIVDELKVPLQDAYGRPRQPYTPYETHRKLGSKRTHYRFVNEQGWEKTVDVPCDIYMVPARYQSNAHTQVIKAIMEARYPWLTEFKCSFYQLSFYPNHVEEFYVKTAQSHGGHQSLYVPYAAFMTKDIAAIEKRNESYLQSYTRSNVVWNSMKDDANVLAFLLKV